MRAWTELVARAPTLPYGSVMVTGADGFVGRVLVAAVAARLAPEARLAVCGRLPVPHARGENRPVDVTDLVAVNALVDAVRPDLTVHLAARSSVAESARSGARTWRVNVDGTLNLAEAMAAHVPGAAMLLISTAEVYGRSFNEGPVDEDSALRPASPYARSKAAAENAAADVLSASNRLIVARPSNHSGPGQDDRFVLPSFARQIAMAERGLCEPVIQVGNLEPERDFLDVRDVVDAYLGLMGAPGEARLSTYNIARGETVPIGTLLDMLLARATCSIAIERNLERMRPAEVARTSINTGRLRAATGWHPRHDLGTLVEDVLNDQRRLVASHAGNV